MSRSACVFCSLEPEQVIAENELAVAIRDKFPVTPLHTLVIPKRHSADYLQLLPRELEAVHSLLRECRRGILQADSTVEGFNVGANVGRAAGQKVFHVHVHLIPRRVGDLPPPPARA